MDCFYTTVKGGRNGVPKMEKGVFFKANVNEHRLEPMFDVADFPLENAPNYVSFTVALDGVFLKLTVLKKSNAFFEFLAADDQFDARA